MGRIVIAVYRPHSGRDEDLRRLISEHVPLLRSLGLASDRPVTAMRTSNGTVLEVFEWRSVEAIERAHSEPAVLELWERFGEVSDYCQLSEVDEAQQMFAEFEPLELTGGSA